MAASSPDPEAPAPAEPVPGELPNLRHLRLLDAAIARQSLSLAAEAIHISQPAASQAVARLGRIFGAPLLERAGNTLCATPEGLIVNRRGRRALDHLREANERLAQRARLGRGPVGDLLERLATVAQLRALSAFAEAGSFAAAARRLGQTEPSVQRAAREIERLTGLPLFDGVYRNLRLTPAGELLAAGASLALKEIATAHAELREHAGHYDGRLVIGTLPLVRTRIVPEAVVALTARHRAARVEIVDGSYESLAHALRIGACDVIVGALRGDAAATDLVEETLFSDELAIIGRAGHPLAGRPAAAAGLAAYPWVLPRRGTPSRAIFDRLHLEQAIMAPAAGYVETGSLVALRGILAASDALAILSRRQIEYDERLGLLTVIDFALPQGHRPIGITTLAGWHPTALHAEFITLLRAAAAAEA
jgi:LysR family transcriptional regulator, regulator for genes of the gallate degradation pathway